MVLPTGDIFLDVARNKLGILIFFFSKKSNAEDTNKISNHFLVIPPIAGEERPYFAQDVRGISLAANQDLPEWKKASFGGNKASFGKRTTLTILEQRQGLPIYKLKEELIKVG